MNRWKRRTWHLISALVILGLTMPVPVLAGEPVNPPAAGETLLPFRYVRVWNKPVSVYASTGDPAAMTPVETLLPPDSWVSIDQEVEAEGRLWYRIADSAYVLASDMSNFSPSLFHGQILEGQPEAPLGFVATAQLNVRARPGAAGDNPPLRRLYQYDTIPITGVEEVGSSRWYRIGSDEYVHGAYVRVVYPVARPAAVPADARWIAVDLAQQTLSAYEGDRMVFATLVSSGRPPWYTPKGLFRIWIKLQTGAMEGGIVERGDYYYLEDVPWIMYFSRDVGLHGAYWHDSFGTPRSHGCVNLSPLDAAWLFDWATPLLPFPDSSHVYASRANPGTWVHVYSSG